MESDLYRWYPVRRGHKLPRQDWMVKAGRLSADGEVYVGRNEKHEVGELTQQQDRVMKNIQCHRHIQCHRAGFALVLRPNSRVQWKAFKSNDRLPIGAVCSGETKTDGKVYVARDHSHRVGKLNVVQVDGDGSRIQNLWLPYNLDSSMNNLVRPLKEGEILIVSPGDQAFHLRWDPVAQCGERKAEDFKTYLLQQDRLSDNLAKWVVMSEYQEAFAQLRWNPDAMCGGHRADARSGKLQKENIISEVEAQQKVMDEFQDAFRDVTQRDEDTDVTRPGRIADARRGLSRARTAEMLGVVPETSEARGMPRTRSLGSISEGGSITEGGDCEYTLESESTGMCLTSWRPRKPTLRHSSRGNDRFRRHDFGVGIRTCSELGCRKVLKASLNRGCLECNRIFCNTCYAKHLRLVTHAHDLAMEDTSAEARRVEGRRVEGRQKSRDTSTVVQNPMARRESCGASKKASQTNVTANALNLKAAGSFSEQADMGRFDTLKPLSLGYLSWFRSVDAKHSFSSLSYSVALLWRFCVALVMFAIVVISAIFVISWCMSFYHYLPFGSAQGHDVFVEVPSIHDALKNNYLNINVTSPDMVEAMHEHIRIVGILGFSLADMSQLAAIVKKFPGDHEWVIAQALLPVSKDVEDKSNTEQFVLGLLATISDILVFMVDDYNWLEQLSMFRHYETSGVIQSSDSCRYPMILQLSDTSGEWYNALRMRVKTCPVESMHRERRLQDVLLDAASSSLRNIIDSIPILNDDAKSAINLSYHSSGIQLFENSFPWSPVEAHAGQHAMNVYEVELNDSNGVPCLDRFIELEFPGAKRSEFEILTSDGHHQLRRVVSDLTYYIDLPLGNDWSVEHSERFTLEDGILTLKHRRCFNDTSTTLRLSF